LKENGCPRNDSNAMSSAAIEGHFDAMKWMYIHSAGGNGSFFSSSFLCMVVARQGRLDMLEWLREKGCSWSAGTCGAAAAEGHVEIVKWLREKGCPCAEVACAGAAKNGNLGLLIWLREQGCPWDKETCEKAVAAGQFEVLKWAREHGCPVGKSIAIALRSGRFRSFRWLLANGCPYEVDRSALRKLHKQRPQVIAFLKKNGFNTKLT